MTIGPTSRRRERDPEWMRRLLFQDVSPILHDVVIDPFTVPAPVDPVQDEYQERLSAGRTKCYSHSEDFKDVTTLDPEYMASSAHIFEDFQEGMTVEMVNPSPYFSRGPVRVGDFGKVTHFQGGVIKVKFFYMSTWSGLAGDFQIRLTNPQYKVGALVRPLKQVRTNNQKFVTRATSEGIIARDLGHNRYAVYFPAVKDEATYYASDLVVVGNNNKDVKRVLTNL